MRVLFDTDVLIDHLRGFAPATAYLSKCQDMERWISAITVMELYAAPSISQEQQEKMSRLFEGLNGIADVTADTARKAGELLARYGKSSGLNPVDALIAATALDMDAVLITRNRRHFDFIAGLIVDSPY
ncbi:MAG: type II toxin-antitoxin system VapC family toxin [Moorellaceae bacterium]